MEIVNSFSNESLIKCNIAFYEVYRKISPSDPGKPLLHTPRSGMTCPRAQVRQCVFWRRSTPSHGPPVIQVSVNLIVRVIIPSTRENSGELVCLLVSPQEPQSNRIPKKSRVSRSIPRFMEWKLIYLNLWWKPPLDARPGD